MSKFVNMKLLWHPMQNSVNVEKV